METTNDSDMFFLSKAIGLLRPSINEGWPMGYIYPLLSFTESIVQKTVDFFEERFNLTPGQLELLKFIQNVHRIHRNEINYQAFWKAQGRPDGPLFLFIFMDDYHDQSNWHYDVLTPQNLEQADLRDDDRERIEAEMAISPPHRFKINFLFVEKTEQFPEQKFLMEIWAPMPSNENEEKLERVCTDFAAMFQSLRSDSFDIHSHSELVLNLFDSYPGDFLRVGLEKMSMQKEIEPLYLMYNQFLGRMAELIRNAKIPEVIEGWRRGEKDTMLMVYRMTEIEEMAQYRGTYGPIVRLTRNEIMDYLSSLQEEKTSADEEEHMFIDYEIRFYERNLELIEEMEEGSMNLLFLHEEWAHEYDVPFACLKKDLKQGE